MTLTRYLLIPDLICETVFDIPMKFLKRKKIKLIIFDIDNTLVPYSVSKPDDKLKELFFLLKQNGIEICFVSNNGKQRVDEFNAELGYFAMCDAQKPKKKSLYPAFEHYSEIKKKNILFVGDQLLTDVLTARKNGIHVIKVRPIEKRENLFFKLKRAIEKPFIKEYYKIEEKRKAKKELKKMKQRQKRKDESNAESRENRKRNRK